VPLIESGECVASQTRERPESRRIARLPPRLVLQSASWMSPILLRIKRCCLTKRIVFTSKAQDERVASGLSEGDVIEAVVNAPVIYKTLR
jgi:hypothetical protein